MIKYIVGIIGVAWLIFLGVFIPKSRFFVSTPITTSPIVSSLSPPWVAPPLTLETIFSQYQGSPAGIPNDKKWTLIATGDIIPARSVNYKTIKQNDFLWSWKNIIPILSQGDITLINLESPLVLECPVTIEGMVFCGDQKHIEGLTAAKVKVANVANNHIGNYGREGIEETKKLMELHGIQVSGLGTPALLEVKGVKIAFLGFDDIGPHVQPVSKADTQVMKKEIVEAKRIADLVIVSMSWGVEYMGLPSDRQKMLAHSAIDFGADLIIGNHPHWIQPVEIYQGKVIMYAHGNTIFDQMWSEETKKGVIGIYTFYGKDLVDIEFIPTYIKEYGQPQILSGREKDTILESLQQQSNRIRF